MFLSLLLISLHAAQATVLLDKDNLYPSKFPQKHGQLDFPQL